MRLTTDVDGERAVTSPLGISLILAVTMAAAVAIVVFGAAAFDDSQRDTRVGQAEQAMTQFDSRVAQVALGDSTSKTVGLGRGDYTIDGSAGSITIEHINYDGDEGTDTNETLYEATDLGAVIYEHGGTKIAYQGGGVWRQDPQGDAQMVSPPEFYYRSATLTFPIVRIHGEDVRSGDTKAHVSREESAVDIYPNSSDEYGDGSPYSNPVSNGTIVVTIESEFCEGWRNYFISRTDGEVSECVNDTVEAEIVSTGTQGDFNIIDGELVVRGVDELEEFKITWTEEGADQESGFNNFEWSASGESDEDSDKLFEIYATVEGGGGGDSACENDAHAKVVIYHSNDSGESFETWESKNDTEFPFECPDDYDELTIDFLGDSDMEYTRSDEYTSGGEGQDLPEYAGHDEDDFVENSPLNETETLEDVIRYYFDEMGDMDLEFAEGNNAGIGDASRGTIYYDGDGRVVTFLHVTENEVRVELRSG